MGKKKRGIYIVLCMLFFMLVISSAVSAGFIDWFKKTITGRPTQSVSLNITVGVPQIIKVYNSSATTGGGLNSGPSSTTLIINFSVYNAAGGSNLNSSKARMNITRTGEDIRENTTCQDIPAEMGGSYANFTCLIQMWWYDEVGTWDIAAFIEDNDTNAAVNTSANINVGSTTGFQLYPTSVTFPGVVTGAKNTTSNNDPIVLNNTGNAEIGGGINTLNVSINATNLRGETNNALALWARNFSMGTSTGGTPPAECGVVSTSVFLNRSLFVNITAAFLENGNYSINNGTAGQEQLYLCLTLAGSELTTQSYSTSNESSWTVNI